MSARGKLFGVDVYGLVQAGKGMHEIAEEYSCTRQAVSQLYRTQAIGRRSIGRKVKGKLIGVATFISGFIASNGYPPSIREIQHHLDLSSTSVVSYYMRELEEIGVIKRGPRGSWRTSMVDAARLQELANA